MEIDFLKRLLLRLVIKNKERSVGEIIDVIFRFFFQNHKFWSISIILRSSWIVITPGIQTEKFFIFFYFFPKIKENQSQLSIIFISQIINFRTKWRYPRYFIKEIRFFLFSWFFLNFFLYLLVEETGKFFHQKFFGFFIIES